MCLNPRAILHEGFILYYPSAGFDVLSEIEKQQEEVWESLFNEMEESPAPDSSFREKIESAVYSGGLKYIYYTIIVESLMICRASHVISNSKCPSP